MNECTENEMQELLPDLLHRTLTAATRSRVEAHLASCEECREELEVLRTVQSAAVFAPVINVDSVVRRIPPYQKIVPAVERPATTRVVSWLVAATMAIAVVGGGSLILARGNVGNGASDVAIRPSAPSSPAQATSDRSAPVQSISPAQTAVETPQTHTPALALAADVGGLSDGSLEQLMTEMARFDALPAAEGDPVILVDTSYSLDQDS